MMRGQTIQFSGEQDAAAILASLDDDVSIDALTWGGRTTPIFLAYKTTACSKQVRILTVSVAQPGAGGSG